MHLPGASRPDDLEQRYLAVMAEVPESNHVLHAVAKTPNELLIIDTCRTEEVNREFVAPGGGQRPVREAWPRADDPRGLPGDRAHAARSRLDEAPS